MGWIIGRVSAITGDTLTMTYKGGTVTDVGILDQYVPTVGDVVHVLTSDSNGMIAIGSNNQPTTVLTPPVPLPPATVVASSTATYRLSSNTWTPSVVIESPDQIGCWFYPTLTIGPGILPLASLTIEVMVPDTTPLEFVLYANPDTSVPAAVVASYRIVAPTVGVAADVALPLGWGLMLINGEARGVGVGGGAYTSDLTGSSGLLTFTSLATLPPS